jgi:hypothetical protein
MRGSSASSSLSPPEASRITSFVLPAALSAISVQVSLRLTPFTRLCTGHNDSGTGSRWALLRPVAQAQALSMQKQIICHTPAPQGAVGISHRVKEHDKDGGPDLERGIEQLPARMSALTTILRWYGTLWTVMRGTGRLGTCPGRPRSRAGDRKGGSSKSMLADGPCTLSMRPDPLPSRS